MPKKIYLKVKNNIIQDYIFEDNQVYNLDLSKTKFKLFEYDSDLYDYNNIVPGTTTLDEFVASAI